MTVQELFAKVNREELTEKLSFLCVGDTVEQLLDDFEDIATYGEDKVLTDYDYVKYSIKQVWVITREKLGLNYCKPFLIYKESPENADEILKKKREI